MSHTVTIDIAFRDTDILRSALEKMGKVDILGPGTYQLYDGTNHTGFGFKFHNWHFPVIVSEDGKAAFDNFNGSWGSMSMMEKLQEHYAHMAVAAECDKLGWYNELNEQTGELVVHHPDGGTITVKPGGTLDANGFVGGACETATQRLEEAMGKRVASSIKPEMNDVQLNQQVIE